MVADDSESPALGNERIGLSKRNQVFNQWLRRRRFDFGRSYALVHQDTTRDTGERRFPPTGEAVIQGF